MVRFQANDDWIQNDQVGLEMASALNNDTLTFGFWIKSDSTQPAPLPICFTVVDRQGAVTQSFIIILISGVWTLAGDDGVAPFQAAVMAEAPDEWRWLGISFEDNGGQWDIHARVRDPLTSVDDWESDLTYTVGKLSVPDLEEHTFSTYDSGAVFGFAGQIMHFKMWAHVLTDAEMWRESQRGLPWVTNEFTVWNPLEQFDDGVTQTWAPRLAGTVNSNYIAPNVFPLEDNSFPPIPIAHCLTGGEAVQITVKPPIRPGLCQGSLLFELACLVPKVGIRVVLDQDELVLIGNPLTAVEGGHPVLCTGLLALEPACLAAKVGIVVPLSQGLLAFDGEPLTLVIGQGAALGSADLVFLGNALVPVVGIVVPLCQATLILDGESTVAIIGQGCALDQGTLELAGDALAAVVGVTAPITQGELLLFGCALGVVMPDVIHIPLDQGELCIVGYPLCPETPAAPLIIDGLDIDVGDADVSATIDSANVDVETGDAEIDVEIGDDVSVVVDDDDLDVEIGDDPVITVEIC